MLRTNSMSCSTTTMVCLPARLRSSSAVRSISAWVMPATGSSTSSTFGSCASNIPISSHCFCPCDSRPASRVDWFARPMISITSSMRFRSAAVRRVNSALQTPLRPRSASSQFSYTVWPWNTVGRWNLRPTPSSAMRHSDSFVRSTSRRSR